MKTLKTNLSILFLLVILSSLFTFISCRKDDKNEETKAFVEENPLAAYEAAAGFASVSASSNNNDYQSGLVFIPKVNGKINSLVAKLPAVNSNLIVKIWDFDSKAVLLTENINVNAAAVNVTKSISPFSLIKDKKYIITMTTKNYYHKQKAIGVNVNYPITAGNIIITGFRINQYGDTTYPSIDAVNFYEGDLSFNFLQNE